MRAQIRIYDGDVLNPESDLLRTIIIEDTKTITSENGLFTIERENGERQTFVASITRIVVDMATERIIFE